MKVKVCGITSLDQLYELPELGVDYAGFIFYPPSPRHVLKAGLTGNEVKKAKIKLSQLVFSQCSGKSSF